MNFANVKQALKPLVSSIFIFKTHNQILVCRITVFSFEKHQNQAIFYSIFICLIKPGMHIY